MQIIKMVEKTKVTGYVCDVCGESCNKSEYPKWQDHEYATLTAHWGYSSRDRDGDTSECHMCEDCFDRISDFIESIGGKVRTMNGYSLQSADTHTHLLRNKKEGTDYVYERPLHQRDVDSDERSGDSVLDHL